MARFRKPLGMRGFWPGRRSTFRRVTRNIRTPNNKMIRMTYTMPEKKFKDTTAVTQLPDTGVINLLNGLSLGTSVTTRIGQKIVVKSIQLRINFTGAPFSQTPTVAASKARCMIVWDNQPNTQLPVLSDILENTTAGTGIVSPQFTGYISRFRILYDKVFNLTNLTAANAPTNIITDFEKWYLKTNLLVSYSDTNNGDINDIITGALLIVLVGPSATAANYPSAEYFVRLRYVDN